MWTLNEIKKLKELYPDNYNDNIGKILNKTKKAVDLKGFRLGLKKSQELLEKRNKSGNIVRIINGGRDLSYSVLKKIADKYKTKIDFVRNDNSAYQAARLKGYLNDICEHMTVLKFSIPQLICKNILDQLLSSESMYNTRKIIPPYELDLYYKEFNLAFEYQGIYWHKNNTNDSLKETIIRKKKINFIKIYEINGSRNYEKDIKEQLIKKLALLSNITGKNLRKKDVLNIKIKNIYDKLYNKKELVDIAKSHTDYQEFKKTEPIVYKKLCKLSLIEASTKHMYGKKLNKIKLTEKQLKDIIKKYDNLTDFRKNDLRIYKHIKRTRKSYLIEHLKRKLN